jgi:hypothetical protein
LGSKSRRRDSRRWRVRRCAVVRNRCSPAKVSSPSRWINSDPRRCRAACQRCETGGTFSVSTFRFPARVEPAPARVGAQHLRAFSGCLWPMAAPSALLLPHLIRV